MAPRLFGFLCLVVHGALALQLPGFELNENLL
jgi:hypothetical protein